MIEEKEIPRAGAEKSIVSSLQEIPDHSRFERGKEYREILSGSPGLAGSSCKPSMLLSERTASREDRKSQRPRLLSIWENFDIVIV